MSASPAGFFQRLSHHLQLVEKGAIIGLFLMLGLFAFLQIVLRNFFATGYVWSDTLLRHMVLWIAYLGAARATAENGHIHISLLERVLPPGGRLAMSRLAAFFSFLVAALLFVASILFVQDECESGYLAFDGVPFWVLEIVFPMSFALITTRMAIRVITGEPITSPQGEEAAAQ